MPARSNSDLEFSDKDDASDNVHAQDVRDILGMSGSFVEKYNESMAVLETYIQLKNVTLKFLACYLIPYYKRERASTYHQVLKEFVTQEMKSTQKNESLW